VQGIEAGDDAAWCGDIIIHNFGERNVIRLRGGNCLHWDCAAFAPEIVTSALVLDERPEAGKARAEGTPRAVFLHVNSRKLLHAMESGQSILVGM
jgi:hypothetical protein